MIDVVLVLSVAGLSALAGFGVGVLIVLRRIPKTIARMTGTQLSQLADKVTAARREP